MTAPTSPTFGQSLLAGAAAGLAVDLSFFPVDTIKTRLQSPQGFLLAGGFRGIYKGVGSVVIGSAPGAAIFFSCYDTLKRISPLPEHLVSATHLIAASIAEVGACLVRVPTELVKTRAQTSAYGPLASSLDSARMVLHTDGLKGFYRGFGITVMREIPFSAIQFPLYELLKRGAASILGRKPLRAYEAAICGTIAGGSAAAFTTPLDVLKTRIMLDQRNQTHASHPSMLRRLQTIYTTEGINALFAGVLPRTIWIGAGGAVFLGVYEWTISGLTQL